MTANGFLEQKRNSPLGFGTVLMLHGAVIAAVVMLRGPGFIRAPDTPTTVIQIEKETPPPPIPVDPPPTTEQQIRTPPPESVVTAPIPVIRTDPVGPVVVAERTNSIPGPVIGTGTEPSTTREVVTVPPRPIRDPVRVASLFDTRFGSQ